MRAAVSGKTMAQDGEFRDQVKDAMVKALVATGVVSSADDPRVEAMSAEDAAQMLATKRVTGAGSGVMKAAEPAQADPAVAEAIRLAGKVAAGDEDAAREVVAQSGGPARAGVLKPALAGGHVSCTRVWACV